MQKQPIYILLTDTGTWFTRLIKWFTNAPFNHVSIVFDEQLQEIYSFGRKRPRNPLFGGFVKENVYTGTYIHFQNTRCVLLKYDVTEEELNKIRTVIRSFERNKDYYSYNLLGLIGVLFQVPITKSNAYFCSQFVAEVFQKSGLDFWKIPPALVTPNHFFTHLEFELVYAGRLYDYPLLDHSRLQRKSLLQQLLEKTPLTTFKNYLTG